MSIKRYREDSEYLLKDLMRDLDMTKEECIELLNAQKEEEEAEYKKGDWRSNDIKGYWPHPSFTTDIVLKEHLDSVEYHVKRYDRPDLEDDLRSAGQMGLLSAWRSWDGTKDNEAKFKTYASRIIGNAVADELKHANVRDKYVAMFGEEEPLDTIDDPEESMLSKEERHLAWRILVEMLPDLSNRQVFILKNRIHCEDSEVWTQKEIASRFKCNQSTIQREEKGIYESLRKQSNMQ